MLKAKDQTLAATILRAPAAQQKTAAALGLKAADVRTLLAVAALVNDYEPYTEVCALYATKLAAITRLREQVATLVKVGCVSRKRRYKRHCLLLTDKGRKAVADCLQATRRAANGFLHL
jgi:hypothetical protein